jgi:hypothetical protein
VYADAVAHRKSIKKLYSHQKKNVVLQSIKANLKPAREPLNDAGARTAFGLADGRDLFSEDNYILLHDKENKTDFHWAKIPALKRFVLSIQDQAQLLKLADLGPNLAGSMVDCFFPVATIVKMQAHSAVLVV